MVEHDPDVIKVADHIVDVGPRAGSLGGEIVFEGTYAQLLEADTLTGKFMKEATPLKNELRQSKETLKIKNAKRNNL